MKNKDIFLSAGTFLGTLIGAGVFGIPYIFSKSGFLVSFFYLFVLFFVSLFLSLFFGEMILRSKGDHRLVGFAEKYLGRGAKKLAAFSTVVGVPGSLLAYIILAGDFLKIIFPASLSSFQFSLIAWFFLSALVFLGLRSIASAEFFMNIGLFIVFGAIFAAAFPKIEPANIFLADKNFLFLPFGVFIFSLIGWSAIPEAAGILKKKEHLKKIIFWVLLTVAVFYFLFGLILSGVTGKGTTEEVFQGLIPFLGAKIMLLGGIFGILAVATSFLILANYFKNTFFLDYRLPYFSAFLISCGVPLILFVLGLRNFLAVVAFVGSIVGLADGIILCLAYKASREKGDRQPEFFFKKPNFFIWFTVIVLVLGAISQIFYYFFN